MCVYYIYIYRERERCIHIYIYIYREREREIEREREREIVIHVYCLVFLFCGQLASAYPGSQRFDSRGTPAGLSIGAEIVPVATRGHFAEDLARESAAPGPHPEVEAGSVGCRVWTGLRVGSRQGGRTTPKPAKPSSSATTKKGRRGI